MSVLTYCLVAFLSRAFVAVCWVGQSPQRGEVWDLFRHLSNKTIYVKLRHHYFVAVLQAYTLYYAQDQQGWVFDILFSCFHAKCTFLLHLTDKNQQCCFVCLLVARWKAQLNVFYWHLVRRCTVFELPVLWQNKFAFVFNNHVLLPVTRSDWTWDVFRPVSAQGCSFITLPSWLTTEFSHQNLFDTFWWEIGA